MNIKFPWKVRHTVLSVLSLTWIVSYVDRSVMAVAIPYITSEFRLTAWESGLVMSIFFAGYAISQIPGGILSDRFGVRRVAAVAMVWWSIFTALSGAAAGLLQMLVIRFVFGVGEGLYPSCVFKAIAVWFPKKERGTANAIKFAAGSVGATVAPLAVVWIMSYWGWRHVFYFMFIPGALATLIFWLLVTDRPADHPGVTSEELAEIEANEADDDTSKAERIGLRRLVREPHMVTYAAVLFSFDITYWGITTWLPTYLVHARGFSMIQMGLAAAVASFTGIAGSVIGGWASDKFFKHNRRTLIILTQISSAILFYLSYITQSASALVVYQALAGFTLNMFFTAFWALPMITVPRSIMGVASGFINMAGQVAAFISPILIGYLVDLSGGGYFLTFGLLIVALIVSFALTLTLPKTVTVD